MEDIKKIFKNLDLLDQALTHKSWLNENPNKRESNERLEFLGDTILQFEVTKYLYNEFPDKSEGYLTALRANIVNTVNLAKFAKEINLRDFIYLSKGESDTRDRISLLADTVEAIIGAVYLDQGIEVASKFIHKNLLNDIDVKIKEPLKDDKSILQETVQAKGGFAPKYKVIKISGPDHDKEFTVEVFVNGKSAGEGKGHNKSQAEQNAAKVALERIVV
jgi:ribonuclease-3